MATVLSITDAEILALARLNLLTGGDAAQAGADVSSVKSYEQEAQEQRIEAGALSTMTLQPLFRRAVAKIIAAEVLEMRARDGSDEGFTGSGVTVAGPNAATDYSRRLRADAERELGPYLILPPADGTDPSEVALREARAGASHSDTVLAQLNAGVITPEEARTTLGIAGAAPVVLTPVFTPSEPSGASMGAQRRLFGRSEGTRFGRSGSDEWN